MMFSCVGFAASLSLQICKSVWSEPLDEINLAHLGE